MRIFSSLMTAALFCAITVSSASAQVVQSVGVVNIQQIMRDSSAAKSVREQLKSKQHSFQAELDAKEKALQQEDMELAKQRANLAEDAFTQKVESFRQKAMAARQEIQNKRAQLDKGFSGALNDIQNSTISIISDVAKEKKLDLVVSSSQVLYSNAGMDITAEVLSRLNSKLPNVSVRY